MKKLDDMNSLEFTAKLNDMFQPRFLSRMQRVIETITGLPAGGRPTEAELLEMLGVSHREFSGFIAVQKLLTPDDAGKFDYEMLPHMKRLKVNVIELDGRSRLRFYYSND